MISLFTLSKMERLLVTGGNFFGVSILVAVAWGRSFA